nr:putative inactive leucine-rich repeat receptor-like protein kinase [Quercus suber]
MESSVVPSTILTPLFRIRSLKQLGMSANSIQGELSGNSFANLNELCCLDLRQNEFNGSIPSQLFQLRYLQYLDLSGNSFHGILSGEELRTLDFGYNLLSMEIPTHIDSYSYWRSISLNHSGLEQQEVDGGIPSSIQNLTELETLELENNLLTGEIPSWLFSINGL